MLMMISLQDHYCSICTSFHLAPESKDTSNHVFFMKQLQIKMTKGDAICLLETLSGQTTTTRRMVSRLNEEKH